ncbi:hypothetical protein PHYPSEUDO_013125 [Phytophthora pseudosyringae]|uniref:Uncharacterized protein n=1 Tax=Phytophthora pseudosyringae TaxID=221518 RepID=A0A8T1V923_9STRA|nr:hypothetical protein PHYPSEUDO_013125 [Phytophthora pseudosyringae]
MESIPEYLNSFDESVDYSDAKEEDDDLEEKAPMPELSEATAESAGDNGEVRSFACILTEVLGKVVGLEPAHDDNEDKSDGLQPSAMTEKTISLSTASQPPLNGYTPVANKVLGRCIELMKPKSNWIQYFEPKAFAKRSGWIWEAI